MLFLFNNAWILFIVATIVNGFIIKSRAEEHIRTEPELKGSYETFIKGWFLYGNIPWVIMMIGNLSGYTTSFFDYMNPRSMNPMILFFHFSIIALWILGVHWIYFKNGAEFIEKHTALFRKSSIPEITHISARQVKILLPLMLLGGIIGMILMWTTEIRVPTV
jgi:hypothetical protein